MTQVYVPQKKDEMGDLKGAASGAMSGYSMGGGWGAAAGAVLGLASSGKGGPQAVQSGSAVDRRIEQMKAKNMELQQLQAAADAVKQLPPEQRIQYEPVINEALMKSQKQMGVV